jgi:hypothetical protein
VSGSRPTGIAEAQHRPLTTDTEVRDDEAEISYLRKNGTKYHCWQHSDCNPFALNSISHTKSNFAKIPELLSSCSAPRKSSIRE